MSNNKGLFRLGEYKLDIEQLILFLGEEEVQAEPKTVELLVYLFEHRDRYVKLEELHQHVWAGRIVSDTAVRNVIKKLRTVLGDTDLADSKYIKSVPKRGYKLICDVTVEQSEANMQQNEQDELAPYVVYDQPVEAVLSSSGGSAEAIQSPYSPIYIPKRFLVACISLIFIAAFVVLISSFELQRDTKITDYQFEQISNFPGEKYGVAASKDGKYLAFTGKTNVTQNSQVYLMDRGSGEIRQLTKSARAATDVIFVNQDQALIYNDTVYGSVSLNLIDISTPEPRITPLISDQPIIGRVVNGFDKGEILFPLMEKGSSSVMLYQLDLASKELKRFTSTSHEDQHDYMVAISPNKDMIAVARKEGNAEYLSIRRYPSQEEIQKVYLRRNAFNLIWKDQQSIYILDSETMSQVSVATGISQEILVGQNDLLNDVIKLPNGEFIFVKHNTSGADGFFVERDLINNTELVRLFDADDHVNSMSYLINPSQFLVVLTDSEHRKLAIYTPEAKHTEIVIDDKNMRSVEVLGINTQNQLALLLVNSRVATLNLESRHLTFHTTAVQKVADAAFSANGEEVLFGEKVAGKWNIYKKSLLENSNASLLFEGYRSIRVTEQGYILADRDGQLFQQKNNHLEALNNKISFAVSTRWNVVDNKLIWTTTDYYETSLHIFDVFTANYQVKTFKVGEFSSRFSISTSGGKILHKSMQLKQTSLAKLKI